MTGGLAGRRLFHLLGGSFFPTVAFFLPRDLLIVGVGGTSLLAIVVEGLRFVHHPFNRWLLKWAGLLFKSQEHFRVTGSTYLLLASLLTFVIFPQPVAIIALLFLAWGDPAAALVGERWGRLRLWRDKSLQGSLAFLLVCLGLGLALGPLTGLGRGIVLVGGVAATLAELFTFGVDDNLTIPLVSAGSMTLAGALSQ